MSASPARPARPVPRRPSRRQTPDEAIATYAAEVRSRAFPAAEHSFADDVPVKK